ncbi:S8 family serine peptidase [Lysobacter sp. A6]|uniref:S8 family serine peptidase n=1 Tax=Noviluteimonas lactosilytica TaxID=2888523 RepID=A0ABS8JGF4_9GAMM|nr:S8 family peptidase [Lysobacter lactosilyticus]MCC8362659.1 S8 family serine peptidase [Lysobacter lactosilyticus]
MNMILKTTLCVALCGAAVNANAVDVRSASNRGMMKSAAPITLDKYRTETSFSRFIVKLRGTGTPETLLATAAKTAGVRQSSASMLSVKRVRTMGRGATLVRTSRALNTVERDLVLAQLRADPNVAWAQADTMKQRMDTVPNDTYFTRLQWDFHDAVGGIGAPKAWDTTNGNGVVVAVIDTGYVDHADLAANIVPGYDFISWYGQPDPDQPFPFPDIAGDGNGRDADAHDPGDFLTGNETFCSGVISNSTWHGTHVAGTIAAVTNNAKGVAGVAYGAKVQPVRVLGKCGGLTSDIADAITWASGGTVPGVPNNPTPAEVLNLSLGGYGRCVDDPATQDAIDGAISRGTTVVVAAGNSAYNAAYFTPASCRGVITVGATGSDGAISYFSNYGANVAIAAPGGNAYIGNTGDKAWIWSTANSGTQAPVASPAGDVVMGLIGTSMASPHVAGAVALMQSASVAHGHPPLTPDLVLAVMRGKARPFPIQPPGPTPIGSGILDLPAVVQVAANGVSEEDFAAPLAKAAPVAGQTVGAGASKLYRITVPAGASQLTVRTFGGAGDVSLYLARNVVPSTTAYGWRSARLGMIEAIAIARPVAGEYFVRVYGEQASSDFTVLATF